MARTAPATIAPLRAIQRPAAPTAQELADPDNGEAEDGQEHDQELPVRTR